MTNYDKILEADAFNILNFKHSWQNLRNKKILISGGTGFIVSYLIKILYIINKKKKLNIKIDKLVRNNQKAKTLYKNILKKKFLKIYKVCLNKKIYLQPKYDYIIHSASLASPKYFKNKPIDVIKPNIIGTTNLLEFAEKNKLKKFIFFSTTGVNGFVNDNIRPINEKIYGPLDPTLIENSYLESKRMGENLCMAWFVQKKIPIQIVRPAITYGPGLPLDDGRSSADFISNILNDKYIILYSNGLAIRNYCYISDFINGLLIMILKGRIGEVYNISNEEEIKVIDLAKLIINKIFKERKLKIKFNKNKKKFLRINFKRTTVSTKKIRKLGWKLLVSIEDGFKRTVQSYE